MSGTTFGTLTFEPGTPGTWVVGARPDVAMRLKRLFPQVRESQLGALTLAHTREVARDLEWVTERWPMEMDAATRAHLSGQADEHRAYADRIADILSGSAPSSGSRRWASSTPICAPMWWTSRCRTTSPTPTAAPPTSS